MLPTSRCRVTVALVSVALLWIARAPAQEPQWRHDYNAARREAREKNRPLILDFGTADCLWCKKLDASTFRDPAVVQLLNERFVPLKIDADKDAPLAKTLGISSFPTLLFATPEGKILGIHEGFVEAAAFTQKLQRALADSASEKAKKGPPGAAAGPAPPVVRGVAPAEDAGTTGGERLRQARELLALAAEDYRTRQYVCCLERCKILGDGYADLPEGAEAQKLAARIKGDPEAARRACEGLSDRLGELYLELAETLLKQGQPQQAAPYLERVLQVSPGSRCAQVAHERLSRMAGQPPATAEPLSKARAQTP
jgi:thioredoxin-related protein